MRWPAVPPINSIRRRIPIQALICRTSWLGGDEPINVHPDFAQDIEEPAYLGLELNIQDGVLAEEAAQQTTSLRLPLLAMSGHPAPVFGRPILTQS